eukprot:1142362-Pelagomonas_calceolata.AAC.8
MQHRGWGESGNASQLRQRLLEWRCGLSSVHTACAAILLSAIEGALWYFNSNSQESNVVCVVPWLHILYMGSAGGHCFGFLLLEKGKAVVGRALIVPLTSQNWFQFLMLDENVSPAADRPDPRAVGQPLVTLVTLVTSQYFKGNTFVNLQENP